MFHPEHPASYLIAYGFLVLPWILALWKHVTPLEILSPSLDTLFLNLIRDKKHACNECGKPCNNRCRKCTHPVCFRHGKVRWGWRVTCIQCKSGPAQPKEESVDDYIVHQLQFFRGKEATRLDPEFATFLYRKLMEGLRRLDDVP